MIKHAFFQAGLLFLASTLGGCGGHTGVTPFNATTTDAISHGAVQKPVVYVSSLSNAVVFYTASLKAKNPSPVGSITKGIARANGLWVDHNDTLYVSNTGYPATIVEYKRGASVPFDTITKGLYSPGSVAVDSAGTLYVADSQSGNVVLVYPRGASSPTQTISIPRQGRQQQLGSMAFDKRGNLLVATTSIESNSSNVYAIAPRSSKAVNLGLTRLPGNALGTDAAGDIFVGGIQGNISVFAPGSKSPTRFIDAKATGFYSVLTVTPDGTVYWPNYDLGQMYEFAPGASTPTNVFSGGGGVDAAVGTR